MTRIDYDRHLVELFAPTGFGDNGWGHILPAWIKENRPCTLGVLYVNGRAVPAKLKLDTGSLYVLGLNGSFV